MPVNNLVEQDHRSVKRRIRPMMGFKSFRCAAPAAWHFQMQTTSTASPLVDQNDFRLQLALSALLRQNPNPAPLADLGVREVFDHLVEVIGALRTKPIIMGHSFGGAFVQFLLDAGFGVAGVSIDGAAVKGVKALPFSEIKATFPVLRNPANLHRAVPITEKEFHYAFTNNLSVEESKAVYDRYAVPVSGRMLFQGGLANFIPNAATTYNFANDDRAPLLFIAGGN
jgi:hypothetical protein